MKRFDALQYGDIFEYRNQFFARIPQFSNCDGIFNAVEVGNVSATSFMFFFGHDLVNPVIA